MIRKITSNDKNIFMELTSEFYASEAVLHNIPRDYHEKAFKELITSDNYLSAYIFESDNKVCGYALLTKQYSHEAGGVVLWIDEIYIREEFRAKGLGRELFKYLEENKGDEITRFRLEVEEDNERAIKLYEKLGFEKLDYLQYIKDFL